MLTVLNPLDGILCDCYKDTSKNFVMTWVNVHDVCVCVCVCVLVSQSCWTLCNCMGCSSPGSSVHGILQARILEWVAIPFSRGSSRPWGQTQVSHIAGRFFTD